MVKKILRRITPLWYVELVTAQSVAGFSSPNNVGGRTATLLFLAVFLRPVHGIALSLGGGVREASRLPVPTFRSANPHIAALFAFSSAGVAHLNVGAMP